MRCALLCLLLPLLSRELPAQISPYRIDTIAGGVADGDGGPATAALLLQSQGLALDSQNRLYLADVNDNRVRRINADGTIETVAGTGIAGFSGDGGLATSAQLRNPYGLAIDANNNLYIADLGNGRVRKVTPSGFISTYVGGGMVQPGVVNDGGVGTDYILGAPRDLVIDQQGNLFVSDFSRNQVYEVSPTGILTTAAGTGSAGYTGDYGAAQLATLNAPAGLTIDNDGSLLICDSGNKVVRRITGDMIQTYLPSNALASGLALSAPTAIAFQPGDFILISDPGAGALYSVSAANDNIQLLPYAEGIAVDGQSNIYLAQQGFITVNAAAKPTITLAGINNEGFWGENVAATAARLNQPSGVAVDVQGNIYIADSGTNRIRRIDNNGTITTFAGTGVAGYTGDGGAATAAELNGPVSVSFDGNGDLLIADRGNNAIRSISPAGIISTAVPPTNLNQPEFAMAYGANIYISNSGAHTVLLVDAQRAVHPLVGTGTAGSGGDGGPASAATLDAPRGLAIDSKGNLYIADEGAGAVRMVSTTGVISTVSNPGNGPWISPSGLAVASDGSLLVADSGTHDIRAIHGDGTVSVLAGTGSAGFSGDTYAGTSAQLDAPRSVFASRGGTILVADTANDRIRALNLKPAIVPPNTPMVKIVNAASGAPGPLAPGEIVEMLGAFELGPQPVSAPANSAELPLYLGDTQVDINGQPVPLLMVESGQITLQIPYGVSGSQSALMQVFYQGVLLVTQELRLGASHPGLYTYGSRSQAMALMQNGAYNQQSDPVTPGSTITVYVTGDGLTNGNNDSGVARTSATTPVLPVSVTIDSKPATLVSATEAVGTVGLLAVQLTIPNSITAGTHAIRVQVGSMATQPGALIWVSPPPMAASTYEPDSNLIARSRIGATATDDPSTVLVLVNDAYLPETGTNGAGASDYVGEHYAAMRNIPSSNIVHLYIPYAGWQSDGQWHGMEYDANQFLSYADYVSYIETPVKNYMAQNGLTNKILYIVPTYGVPVMLGDTVWRESIDSLLSIMNSGIQASDGWVLNPYRDATATGSPAHFGNWVNPNGYKMYLVTRLDGPSAVIAASLVDKAMQAEQTLTNSSGIGYFDFIDYPSSNAGDYPLDQTMLNAYNTSVTFGIPSVLNNQSVTGHPIKSGPNSAWVWGWYVPALTDAYPSPVTGAIGSQATSYACNTIRDGGQPGDSNWCAYFLLNGFAATWGATGEPYTVGIATGDSLFGHFWQGYNFAESSYLANPFNNWMMVFIGDPLYALKHLGPVRRLPFHRIG